ncbi:MAG: enoyl-CoA hydratase [Calditrichaeota bacterium]|nr:MAG: enoyl-CoA hydratase [Calditrichota bacterium]
MEWKTLLLEKQDGYAVVTINRPDKLNALNGETIGELQQMMEHLREDEAVRAVVLTGAGEKAFVAGADISEIAHLDGHRGEEFAARGQAVFHAIEQMPIPVIAAINGFALGGGCELAMACHLRLASEKARLGQPEINLGIIPGYGGTQRLPRLVGLTNALYLLLTGEMIDAARAYELGLVNEVLPPDQLMPRARELAGLLAQKAPLAVRYILEAVYRGADVGLDEALQIEARYFGQTCTTEDMKEGTTAFLEKRKPTFRGR